MFVKTLSLFVGCLAVVAAADPSPIDLRITELLQDVRGKQWLDNQSYWPTQIYPPIKWNHQAGLYESHVHVNAYGNPAAQAARHLYNFPDNNGFVSMFVLDALLEAQELGAITVRDQEALLAVNAILNHQDPNKPAGSREYNFWNMRCDLPTKTECVPTAPNIDTPIDFLGDGLNLIAEGFKKLGLGAVYKEMAAIASYPDVFLDVFRIPSDADDSGCALALSARLSKAASLPLSKARWEGAHGDLSYLMDHLEKYAYKPFSQDPDASLIDPRTYYWIHPWVLREQAQAKAAGTEPEVSVITTWLLSTSEMRKLNGTGAGMPFNVNNVDASVVANALHGFVEMAMQDPDSVLPLLRARPQFVKMMESSSRLLEFLLQDEVLLSRPDLALLYYPPIYDCYWFVARIVKALSTADLPKDLPVFATMRDSLGKAMQGAGTAQLLNMSSSSNGYTFWDDFLGDGDTNILGKPDPQHEDRVFSSAVALNALLDTWTVNSEWRPDTPADVKSTVSAGVSWLLNGSAKFPRENAFFSGSVKGVGVLPFWYPSNVLQTLDGQLFECSGKASPGDTHLIAGVQGLMDEAEWEQKMEAGCFGEKPLTEKLDMSRNPFPFWSSPALTSALEMLALAKYNKL